MADIKIMWREGLFVVMALFALVQLFYYWIIFRRLAFYNGRDENDNSTNAVSVIICAKRGILSESRNNGWVIKTKFILSI